MIIRVGTAGWSVPADVAAHLPPGSSALHRYGSAFNAAEINSTFHRSHRASTYARWAASVDDGFEFSVKLPKTITHVAKLLDVSLLVEDFLSETSHLGAKRGPVLVQTPPKLAFDGDAVESLVERLRAGGVTRIVWEARHATWFTPEADDLLAQWSIARVAADPAALVEAAMPGGARRLAYYRFHGSPRMYYSAYDAEALQTLADAVRALRAPETWVIFDNTAAGEAARDALKLIVMLESSSQLEK